MQSLPQQNCYHCQLPVPANFSGTLQILGESRQFCCNGCLAVAEMIVSNRLDDYYKFRTEIAVKPEQLSEDLSLFDDQDVLQSLTGVSGQDSSDNPNLQSIKLISEHIHCSACAWLIEKQISKSAAVAKIAVNVSQQTIILQWDPEQKSLSDILKQMHQLGYPTTPYQLEKAKDLRDKQQKAWLRRLGLAGLGMMQVMMYAVALYIGAFDDMSSQHRNFLRWVSFLVATPVLLYSALPFFRSALNSLSQWRLNMDVPIVLALSLAYLSSIWASFRQSGEVYFDSVTMFVFFLLIGRYLEFRVRQKISDQMSQKEQKMPLVIERFTQADSSQTKATPLAKIKPHDEILVKAGAIIPCDGFIVDGQSAIDQAMLSGEFTPLDKQAGDKVLAGSINCSQPLRIKVSSSAQDGYLNQLKQLQEQALIAKPHLSLVADKVARYFVAAILLIATATYFYWSQQTPDNALWITIAVLVVSCPCALSLATPVALTCSVAALNKRNFLVRGENFLNNITKISDLIFDKTGTLTQGKFSLKNLTNHSSKSDQQLLAIIAALESQSEHPIAKAFQEFASPELQADQIETSPFAGVSAIIDDERYYFGNLQYLKNQGLTVTSSQSDTLLLTDAKQLLAEVLLADKLRADAFASCQQLKNSGLKLHLLSGDPSDATENLANQLQISAWHKAMLPQDKIRYVQQLQQAKNNVLMVGDGINDAPVMALSNASIAMQGAADFTKNNADAYLLSGQLSDLEFAIGKAQQTNRIIKQNLGWALVYNSLVLPFAIAGMIPPYLAALGMSFSSIVVVINSLRLNR